MFPGRGREERQECNSLFRLRSSPEGAAPVAESCLPGKSLVVYEPGLKLVTDLVLGEDAYTQERVLLTEILPRVQPGDLWLAYRKFCTSKFVFGMSKQRGRFLVRQHRSNLARQPLGKLQPCGQTETGSVSEQLIRLFDRQADRKRVLRRIVLHLFEKTRAGEPTLALLTNLPAQVTAGRTLPPAVENRARISVPDRVAALRTEILGQAAGLLVRLCMALVASNALAVVRANLRQAHGVEQEAEVSGYYLADEMAADYRTVMKYLPAEQWRGWQALDAQDHAAQRDCPLHQRESAARASPRSRRGKNRFTTENIRIFHRPITTKDLHHVRHLVTTVHLRKPQTGQTTSANGSVLQASPARIGNPRRPPDPSDTHLDRCGQWFVGK
jgi:hypothetical protein